ncbi:MAG: HAD family hydrolase, partial [Clostridia bacterium]|nr:HAD family hydrolase [Clostridia bacterium]
MKQIYALSLSTGKKRMKDAVKALKAVDGVKRLKADYRRRLIRAEFDEGKLSAQFLEQALRDMNLEVGLIAPPPPGHRSLRNAVCWVLSLFMIYITLASRVILPVPEVFSYPLSAGITQLVLMLVVWVLSYEVFLPGKAGREERGSGAYTFAALASVCAALYSVPALIVAAWRISEGVSVNIELFFDSAALLPTLATLGITAGRRQSVRTRRRLREMGFPPERLEHIDADRTRRACLAVKLSRAFSIIAAAAALASLVVWLVLRQPVSFAVRCAVCVLVLACPNIPRRMAPALITKGVADCAENGTPVNNAAVLEQLRDVDTVIFESHDALTRSEAVVKGCVLTDGMSRNMLIALAASALQQEKDGVSQAILKEAEENRLPLDPIIEKEVNEDSDVRALVGETRVLVGSYDFMLKNALDMTLWEQQVDELTNEGLICVMVASTGTVKGIITLESRLLPRVCETMRELRGMNVETYVMATENTKAARVLAQQVGADKSVYPQDAEIAIRLLTADKRNTLYVYGGESPVFDVPGLKMNLSVDAPGEAQVRGRLGDVPEILSIARRTFRGVNRRLRLWLVYEIPALLVAAGVLYRWPG